MISARTLLSGIALASFVPLTSGQNLRLIAQAGHSEPISSLVFSADHRILVTGSSNGAIVWDVASGREICTMRGRAGVAQVALSPDKKYLATAGGIAVAVWDVRTGLLLRTVRMPPQEMASCIAFSPTKPLLAIGTANLTVCLCDFTVDGEAKALPIPPPPPQYRGQPPQRVAVTSLLFTKDGATLASGYANGTVGLWNLSTQELIRTLSGGFQGGSLGYGNFGAGSGVLALSPDGLTLTNGQYFWNLASPRIPHEFPARYRGSTLAFSSNETLVVAEQSGATHVIDTRSGREVRTLGPVVRPPTRARAQTFRGPVRFQLPGYQSTSALSPDGQLLAVSDETGAVQLWDVSSGNPLNPLRGHADAMESVSLAPDGFSLAVGGSSGAWFWDSAGIPSQLANDKGFHGVAFSPDGRSLACSGSQVSVFDVATKGPLAGWTSASGPARRVVFSPDGKLLAGGWGNGVELWDFPTGAKRFDFGTPSTPYNDGPGPFIKFSLDGKFLATAGGAQIGNSQTWDVGSGGSLGSVGYSSLNVPRTDLPKLNPPGSGSQYPTSFQRELMFRIKDPSGADIRRFTPADSYLIGNLATSPDGKTLATLQSTQILLWDSATGLELRSLRGHSDLVSDLSFSADARSLASVSQDRTVKIWNVGTGAEMCTISVFDSGIVAVVDPEGRFDVSSLDGDVWLNWVAPDAPFTPLPIEIFTRDYFEPGLLAKTLHHQTLRPVKSIADLNRAQPTIELKGEVSGDEAQVTVRAGEGKTEVERDGNNTIQIGRPQDLRVFIDGKLAGYQDGPLVAGADGKWSKAYTIPLPHNGEKEVEISAYCFNQSRVKSATVRQTLALDLTPRKGKAYVISVGVDHYRRSDLALSFSAADATSISETLKARLAGYSEVVTVPLLSNAAHHDATKAKFHAVLDALAGRKVDLSGIPNGGKLAKTTPEDLVIISWSGHGLSSKEGNFYLLPEDVKNDPDTFGKAFLASCVSTDELTAWLRDVNSADMALIVDACHSAAAVQSEEFKPGPLGNRGLGQLAYDKGIRVLAATQAANVALESGQLGNGLLTYALIHDGLGAAKSPTLKEWLAGAVDDVPKLYVALQNGALKAAKGSRGESLNAKRTPDTVFRQHPALFDYTRRPSPVPFVGP